MWRDKFDISYLNIIFYNDKLWPKKIWARTDKKHQFFSQNRPENSIFKEIRAKIVKYTAN